MVRNGLGGGAGTRPRPIGTIVRNRAILIVAIIVAFAAPAYAQSSGEITQADVDAAREERNRRALALAETTAQFEQAVADEEFSKERIAHLEVAIAELEADIADRQVLARDLVRNRYMSGGTSGTERLFAVSRFEDLPIQSEYYEIMSARDHETLRGLQVAEELHHDRQAEMVATLAEQEALVADIVVLRDEILAALESADAEYSEIAVAFQVQEEERRRREEEERLRREAEARAAAEAAAAAATSTTTVAPSSGVTTTTAPAATTTTSGATTTTSTTVPTTPSPVVTDGKTCPINAATSFSDTWGAPRSGGRTHKGVDMMAARGAPIVAIESGVVTRTSNSSLGGLSIYLTGASGSRYYYAHLDAIASGVGSGTQVSVGDYLGENGSTGNAPDWLPHLHFQYAPAGSDWVNPYPLVRALC